MIFITVGSQKFQFNRLLKEVDRLIQNNVITDRVIAQIGVSDYKPLHFEYKEFYNQEEFAELMKLSNLIITHGGTGVIVSAVKQGKKVIAIPRVKEFDEHVDNHQIELLQEFNEKKFICFCEQIEDLEMQINRAATFEVPKYNSNTEAYISNIQVKLNSMRPGKRMKKFRNRKFDRKHI